MRVDVHHEDKQKIIRIIKISRKEEKEGEGREEEDDENACALAYTIAY